MKTWADHGPHKTPSFGFERVFERKIGPNGPGMCIPGNLNRGLDALGTPKRVRLKGRQAGDLTSISDAFLTAILGVQIDRIHTHTHHQPGQTGTAACPPCFLLLLSKEESRPARTLAQTAGPKNQKTPKNQKAPSHARGGGRLSLSKCVCGKGGIYASTVLTPLNKGL
jgi:hypothetical protein